MSSVRAVPAFDEVENRDAGLGLVAEPMAVGLLMPHCRDEAYAHRVVVRISDRVHRRAHTELPATESEGERGVLRALIAEMDRRVRSALSESRAQGVEDELGAMAQPTTRRLQASSTTA